MTRANPTTEPERADDALIYVVISSPSPAGGRPADWPTVHGVLRSSFPSEHEARQVFIETRRRRDTDWAELVALDGRGSAKRIAWFGSDPDLHHRQTKEQNMQATQTVTQQASGDEAPPRRHSRRRRLIATAALAVLCAGGVVAKSSVHSSGAPSIRPSTATFSGIDAPRDGVDGPAVPRVTADPSSQVPNVDPAFAGGTVD